MKTIKLLLLILLTGCAPYPDEFDYAYEGYNFDDSSYTFTEYGDTSAKGILKDKDLYCHLGESCPEALGVTISLISKSVFLQDYKSCTSFLVASNIVATNSHCLPKNFKDVDFNCSSEMSFKFFGSTMIFNCKKIISQKYKDGEFDYAFIEIKDTNIEPFKISKNSFEDGEILYTHKLDPVGDSYNYKKGTCEVVMSSLINYEAVSKWSKTGQTINCKVIKGNSGSPVVNAQGEVVGIAQSYIEMASYKESLSNIIMPSSEPDNMTFSNLACIDDPIHGHPNQGLCEANQSHNISSCSDHENFFSLNQNTYQKIEEWKNDQTKLFNYQVVQDRRISSFLLLPVCVNKQHLRGKFFEAELFLTHKTKIQVDEKYKISRFLEWSDPQKWNYKGTVKANADKWEVDYYSIYAHDYAEVFQNLKKILLPSCSDYEQQEGLVVTNNNEILTRSEFEESFQNTQSMCIGI